MSRLIRAVINTQALRHNLRKLRERLPGVRFMAVIKANAYGHGIVPAAHALTEADAFGVARLEEGVELREAGVDKPIVLLEGVFSAEQLIEASRHSFELVVHDPIQIEILERAGQRQRFVLWIKIDTGMNRLGFRMEDFPAALERLRKLVAEPNDIRLMTHFARADEPTASTTREQIERFRRVTRDLPFPVSLCNSAGLLGWPEACGDWARPGLSLYGVSPFPDKSGASFGLEPAMTLHTTIIATRRVLSGETVGYGGVWQAKRNCTIAILAGGYGDGLPRRLTSGTPVLVGGQRASIVGRVSMDMMAVDASALPDVRVGTPCVLWGKGLPVEEIAAHAGTIPYELLCGLTRRVPLELV